MHNGKKMSKSLGNVINPFSLIDQYGSCALRYFLMAETTVGKDGDFSESSFLTRCNAELSDNLGNLVHRVLSFINKRFDGLVPSPHYSSCPVGTEMKKKDDKLLALAVEILASSRTIMTAENDLHKIINMIIKIPREGMNTHSFNYIVSLML